MRVKFCVFGKVNFIGVKTSRQLTCLYIEPLIFFVKFGLKCQKKNYYAYFSLTLILLIFGFGWQLGVVHAGLSAVSDCGG